MTKNIKEAISLDEKNGNTPWHDAYAREIYHVNAAFKILQDGEHIPVGYKKSSGHLIFDIKMDFIRKA